MMIEAVAADISQKDELIAIIRRSMKLEEQRQQLTDIISDICRKSNNGFMPRARVREEQAQELHMSQNNQFTGDSSPLMSHYSPETMQGISYDKSQSRYRTSYKKNGKLIQKVFSIRAHGEAGALQMAMRCRNQWISEGKVTPKRSGNLGHPQNQNSPGPPSEQSMLGHPTYMTDGETLTLESGDDNDTLRSLSVSAGGLGLANLDLSESPLLKEENGRGDNTHMVHGSRHGALQHLNAGTYSIGGPERYLQMDGSVGGGQTLDHMTGLLSHATTTGPYSGQPYPGNHGR